jgi:Fe-Mn family superoxide dismutase
VAKLNELTSNTPLANKSIPELIKSRKTIPVPVFNSAAQTWNHDFYWKSLKPGAHGFEGVGEKTKRGLESSFGSMENFKKEFSAGTFSLCYWFIRACDGWNLFEGILAYVRLILLSGSIGPQTLLQKTKETNNSAAAGHFGSGWAWLVLDNTKATAPTLKIVQTHDAGSPLEDANLVPLLTCDVWEHAYYLDYQNKRPEYIDGWWKLVNWDFAERNLEAVASTSKVA